MALDEELGHSRTEAPTPRRREEARAEGRIPSSPELTGGLVLLCGLAAIVWGSQTMAGNLVQTVRLDFLASALARLEPEHVQALFVDKFGSSVSMLGGFFAVTMLAALAVSALQAGVHFVPGLVGLRADRLTLNTSKVFSLSGLTRGMTALAKVAVVLAAVWWMLKNRSLGALSGFDLAGGVSQAWALVARVALTVAGTLVLIGIADFSYQWWRNEQSLRMSKQELKEESKREDGDPQVKARIRKLQREASRKRMFQDVPQSTVIITNPTHLAVALRYESGVMTAPKVLAKGAGFVAQRIIEIARRHGVPVVERKPIARALYQAVQVGQEIPAALYIVVAEVLAFVYRMRGITK